MVLLLFAGLIIALLIGFPVAITLGGYSLIFGILAEGSGFLSLLSGRIFAILNNSLLMAVPLFIFMGVLLEKSGIAEELLETMALIFGRIRGGMAVSVVVVGALLAASTGIVGATVVTMGMISLPTMLKRGYSPELATGTIASSGTLGQIIPPSIVLILLGDTLSVSVGDLFLAALFPGLLLVSLYIFWILIYSWKNPESAPTMPKEDLEKYKGKLLFQRIFKAFVPPITLILAVLGSIFLGIATPTEAAAVGALGAAILNFCYGKLTKEIIQKTARETTHLTCMVFFILIGATVFSTVFRIIGGDDYLQGMIQNAQFSPNMFVLMALLLVFIAGFFIDFIEIIFIFVPILMPIFTALNIDLLWIGILLAVNLQTSFLTPPFGFSLFYLKGVAPPEITTKHIYKGIIPFIVIQLVVLILIFLFPQISLWLPKYLETKVKTEKQVEFFIDKTK